MEKKEDIVIADKKYFLFSGIKMPRNAGFYTDNIDKCPENVKYAGKEKFPSKVFVWVTISNAGILTQLILKAKSCSIKSEIYIEECLLKRLLPFLYEHYPEFQYIFWPDLTSANYSNATVAWTDKNLN